MQVLRFLPSKLGALIAAAAVTSAIGAAPAKAQFFPDNEARRAIVELRDKNEADRKQLTETDIKLTEQLQQLQRSMLELSNQIEGLKSEVARLRGANEQLARDLAEVQRAQKDQLQKQAEEQNRKAEAMKATMDGREFTVEPEKRRQFEEALGVLRTGDYAGAAVALGAFQKRWPSSGYTDAARFWRAMPLRKARLQRVARCLQDLHRRRARPPARARGNACGRECAPRDEGPQVGQGLADRSGEAASRVGSCDCGAGTACGVEVDRASTQFDPSSTAPVVVP